MQVITAGSSRHGPSVRSIALGSLVGAILFFGGLVVAWLAFATPFITRFTPGPRPETAQMVAGMLAWTFALVAPGAFIVAGLARIVAVFESVHSAGAPRVVAKAARKLGEQFVVIARLKMPDGRVIPELVVGPFGAAVIEELPPSGATRHKGDAWQVRMSNGTWAPLENPLERAGRDADRVRRLFAEDDQDFVLKVYAAAVAPDTTPPRTPGCAVITRDQIPAWIESLPPQRSLTDARRERLIETLRGVG
jgi:hypothetical protein